MLFLARYLMQGSKQATISVVILSALTVFVSLFGVLWGASIGLVTLRLGMSYGAKLLVLSSMTSILLSVLLTGSVLVAISYIVLYAIPLWVLAVLLRKTQSLEKALILSMLSSLLVVVIFHLAVGDTILWWKELLINIFNDSKVVSIDMSTLADKIQLMAHIMTTIFAILLTGLWFGTLLLSRWWQSKLYFPGRFKKDFFSLKLPVNIFYIAIFSVILRQFFNPNNLLTDISAVLIVGLMFQGLAVAHKVVDNNKYHSAWLVSLYILLSLIPEMILILAILALFDNWFDLRKLNSMSS